jgi:hypothetical protein
MMSGWGRKIAGGIAAGVLLAVSISTFAWAYVDNIMPTLNFSLTCRSTTMENSDTVCQTDNNNFVYYLQPSTSGDTRYYVNQSMSGSFNGTNLNATRTGSPVYEGSAETDVILQQGTAGFSGRGIGITWCNNQAGGIWQCDQQYIKFKIDADRALACHEIGHSVGLLHGENSSPYVDDEDPVIGCMIRPHNPIMNYLGVNNVTGINQTYPP